MRRSPQSIELQLEPSLWPSANPSKAARESLASPEFSMMCVDANRDYPRFIEVLLRGLRSSSDERTAPFLRKRGPKRSIHVHRGPGERIRHGIGPRPSGPSWKNRYMILPHGLCVHLRCASGSESLFSRRHAGDGSRPPQSEPEALCRPPWSRLHTALYLAGPDADALLQLSGHLSLRFS